MSSYAKELAQLKMDDEQLKELDKMIADFKPQFGIPDHISIAKNISELNDLVFKQKRRAERYKGMRIKLGKRQLGQQTLERWGIVIRKLKRELHWQLKQYGKENAKTNSAGED